MERVTLPNSLVGRHGELGRLAMLGRQALTGQLRGATVLGPAGVGKSRLVDEAIARLDGSFEQVEVVSFPERPLGAYRQTRRLLRGFLGAERAATLVASVVDSALDADVRQREVADLADEITENLAGHSRLVVLEDLHWAPVESLELVDYLVSEILDRGQHLRCMIVANTRPLAPDAAVQAVLNRWQRSRLWNRLVVPPLSDGEVAVLVRHLGVAGDHWRQLDPILRRAMGNPLHVIALVEGLSQNDDEAPSDLLPRELQDAVEGWLSRLAPAHRAVLGVAGLLGDRFTSDQVCELQSDAAVVQAALDQSLHLGLVEQRRGWLSFLHPLVRAAAVADLPLAERTVIHLRRAALLADAPLSAAERTLGQAHHLIEVGAAAAPEVALPVFCDAAEVSARLSAWPDCARFAETALELGGKVAAGFEVDTRIDLVFLAGRAHSWNGDNVLAATRYRQVIDWSDSSIDANLDERVAQSVLDLARLQIVNVGTRAGAEIVPLLRGVAANPAQPRHRALALELLAEEATLHGRLESGMQLADDALAAAKDACDDSAIARALFARGATHLAFVELAGARRDFVDSLAAAERADDRTARNWAITRAAHAAWLSGRLDEADQLRHEGRSGTRSHRHLGSEGYAAAVEAGVALGPRRSGGGRPRRNGGRLHRRQSRVRSRPAGGHSRSARRAARHRR